MTIEKDQQRDGPQTRPAEPDEQVELDGSPRRRLGLSLFIVVTLAAIATVMVPPSVIRERVGPVAAPYLLATGLDQYWGVFAPNPPRVSTSLLARVVRADGTSVDYPVPHGRGPSAYWDYRWLKYGDQILEDKKTDDERAAFALWAVREDRAAGGRPARVVLVRRAQELLPPGPGPDEGRFEERPIFAVTVERAR